VSPAALTTLGDLSPGEFLLVVVIAAGLSMGVFWHASKRGSRHPTAWGIATFLAAGVAIPLYAVSVVLARRRQR
jgi:hypothetical protein